MQSFIENHEAAIRLSAFVGMLVDMGLWETLAPRRVLALPRWLRWLICSWSTSKRWTTPRIRL